MDFFPGQFTQKVYHEGVAEWWYDPYTGQLIPQADHVVWEYDIIIDPIVAFVQEGTATNPIIYWLDVYVETETGTFGWKTTSDHWNDDAVYMLQGQWQKLVYPSGHPYHGESIDLAFRLTTTPVCCFSVAIKPLSFFRVKALITETCGENHTNVPWNITVKLGANNKYFTGTIPSIAAGGTVVISTGLILWLGPALTTVTINDCPPVQKKVFFIFFAVIALPL
jgi:hypothetical protein